MKRNLFDHWLFLTCNLVLVWHTALTTVAEAQPLSLEARREAANQALLQTLRIKPPAAEQLLKLLRAEQFAELDSILAEVEKKYKADVNYESAYVKAYDVFVVGKNIEGFIVDEGHDKDDLLAHLDKWVKDSPANHKALCARGIHKVSLGWRSRGNKVTSKVPEANLAKMRQLFTEGQQDLRSAVKLQPGMIPAYFNLIEIAKNLEGLEETTQWLERAIQADPRSYYVRQAYMIALQPKWLGSLDEMEDFGRETADYVAVNPRLWVLQGEVYIQRADLLRQKPLGREATPEQRKQKREAVIDIYNQAFEYGDRLEWLKERSNLYIDVKNYRKALEDTDKYLTYQPDDIMMQGLKQGIVCLASNIKPCVPKN